MDRVPGERPIDAGTNANINYPRVRGRSVLLVALAVHWHLSYRLRDWARILIRRLLLQRRLLGWRLINLKDFPEQSSIIADQGLIKDPDAEYPSSTSGLIFPHLYGHQGVSSQTQPYQGNHNTDGWSSHQFNSHGFTSGDINFGRSLCALVW